MKLICFSSFMFSFLSTIVLPFSRFGLPGSYQENARKASKYAVSYLLTKKPSKEPNILVTLFIVDIFSVNTIPIYRLVLVSR